MYKFRATGRRSQGAGQVTVIDYNLTKLEQYVRLGDSQEVMSMAESDGLLEGRFYTMGEIERTIGIPAATLRAWERRYGAPTPGRSSGRHRLYSEYDLAMLKWLLSRQEEGMSISRAVAAWRYQAERHTQAASIASATVAVPHGLETLRSEWVDACLRYERAQAELVLGQAFALFPTGQVCTELLLGGISRIGDAWFRGEVTVHQEHFASAIASHQVEKLIAATIPWRRERVLLACPARRAPCLQPALSSPSAPAARPAHVLLGADVPMERLDTAVARDSP